LHCRYRIDRMRFAPDGKAVQAEFQFRNEVCQRSFRTLAARQAVRANADVVPAFCLSGRKVEDMAKDASDGSAQGMDDTERAVGLEHGNSIIGSSLKSMTQRTLTAQQP